MLKHRIAVFCCVHTHLHMHRYNMSRNSADIIVRHVHHVWISIKFIVGLSFFYIYITSAVCPDTACWHCHQTLSSGKSVKYSFDDLPQISVILNPDRPTFHYTLPSRSMYFPVDFILKLVECQTISHRHKNWQSCIFFQPLFITYSYMSADLSTKKHACLLHIQQCCKYVLKQAFSISVSV